MIHHVDRALEQFFRDVVAVPAATIDISFRTPDPAWTAGLTRPTIDVFLWDISKSDPVKHAGIDEEDNPANGRRRRRPPSPVITLRYLVTVWTREHRDEHELLGTVLTSVLGHSRIPDAVLPDALAGTRCSMAVADDDTHFPHELWSGPGVKAAVNLQVAVPVDAIAWQDRGTPVEVVAAQVHHDDRTRPPGSVVTTDPAGSDDAEPVDLPSLRRRRQHGALVMEGRSQPADPR